MSCETYFIKTVMPLSMKSIKSQAVGDLDYTILMRHGSKTNPLSWQGNIDYRKSALDYATL